MWPFALGYFVEGCILATWCEQRQDFRHFCTDRIGAVAVLDERYPEHRGALLRRWRAAGADQRHLPDAGSVTRRTARP